MTPQTTLKTSSTQTTLRSPANPVVDIAHIATELSLRDDEGATAADFAVACSEAAEACGLDTKTQIACLLQDAASVYLGLLGSATVMRTAVSIRFGVNLDLYESVTTEICEYVKRSDRAVGRASRDESRQRFLSRYMEVRHGR
ncbi:hypothetical protein [Planctomycetes bacterium TBK1r]|uniref:Uncharacterized protein n=1 Tax=Stieleria magnilauensis TaxID=2527963 RepID=A0ABX5Y065_9BACT|nr:hypothetical protein TBK1r_64460 [Planctomycetes bacterium TBK1r]